VIDTARLLLRPPARSDADAVVATIDVEVERLNGWSSDRKQRVGLAIAMGRAGACMVVCDRRSGEVLGVVQLERATENGSVTHEVGCWVGAEGRARGVGTEAVGAVVDRAHAKGIATVTATMLATNEPARRLVERLGFTRVGMRPRVVASGAVIDELTYVHTAG